MTLLLGALMGCAVATAPPPTLEGRVDSVSQRDIKEAIALVEREMRHDYWIVYPIDRVEVRNHNEIWIIYRHGTYEHSTQVLRIHGQCRFRQNALPSLVEWPNRGCRS